MARPLQHSDLLTATVLEAEIGVLLRYEIIDQESEMPIGYARGRTIWDLERRPLVQLISRDPNRSMVVHSLDEPIGSIHPTTPQTQDWLRRTAPPAPSAWTGTLRLARTDDDVARVRQLQITSLQSKRPIATVGVPRKKFHEYQHHGLWTMRFFDQPSRALRIMALAWLLVAWKLQRNLDLSEHGTPLLDTKEENNR
jgi:hypothetical protein